MHIYADTSNVEEIQKLWDGGLIQGITTNPSIIAKEYGTTNNWHNIIKDICRIVDGPISAEVVSTEVGDMVLEGQELSELHERVVVKLPCTPAGVKACKVLAQFMDIRVNMTLCFSVAQAILAANAGASFISPFVGRMDDEFGPREGVALVKEIHHQSSINYGTGKWDILNKDNLTASYGVYIYHIEANGIGEKIGKLAIVK